MAKHRHLTELDNAWLATMEQEIGLTPVAARGVGAGVGPRVVSGPPRPQLCRLAGWPGSIRFGQHGDPAGYYYSSQLALIVLNRQ